MKRAEMGVYEWLNDLPDVMATDAINSLLGLSGTYNEESITIASGIEVITFFQQLWGERRFYTAFADDQAVDKATHLLKIASIYSMWKEAKLNDLLRGFYALSLEYEPLDNYNGYEKVETSFGKTIKNEYGKEVTITHGKTNSLATDIYGYNSTDASNSDLVTSTDGGTTKTKDDDEDNMTEGGKETVESTKRGNLGVTTSQQMLLSEWSLRRKNFVIEAIRDFIDTYTAY